MTDRAPASATNLDRYGSAQLEWSRVHEQLVRGSFSVDDAAFLGTTGADGAPHAAGIGPVWWEGDIYVTSGPRTRKGRDLVARPDCTLSVRFGKIDVVFECRAQRVTDAATLRSVVAVFNDGGWPAEVEGDAFTAPYSAPSAGPPPWQLFRLSYHTVTCVAGAEPYGATGWTFS
jgi:hypothetical protein